MLLAPASAAAQTPTQDSVVGSGGGGGDFSYESDVRSGPSGENPTGLFVGRLQDTGEIFFGGPPTCLAVRGNVATMVIRSELGPLSGGFLVTIQVTDAASDTVEIGFGRLPDDCSPLVNPIAGDSLTSGDLRVTDAPPLPASASQCKHGGWRTYGVFKNQGDCVSFVATGGKNAPARGTSGSRSR